MENLAIRAMRRHHVERLKAKWKRIARMEQAVQQDANIDTALKDRMLGMFVHTRRLCSCWMCGNPRKHTGLRTLQERKMMQRKMCNQDLVAEEDY